MNAAKEKKRISGIKPKLTLMIVLFTALLLTVVWILCVVFLDDFYKQAKSDELTANVKTIESKLGSSYDELSETVNEISASAGASVIVYITDGDGKENAYAAGVTPMSFLSNRITVGNLIKKLEEDGGEMTYILNDMRDRPVISGGSGDMADQYMLYGKIIPDGGGRSVIIISVTLASVDTTRTTIKQLLIIVSAVFVVLSAILGLLISGTLSAPLEKLNAAAKYIGTSKYKRLEGDPGCRETAELDETLSRASDELAKVDQLRRELIANVSHDLRTPLTMISGYGEMMRDIPGENNAENIRIIIEEAEHLNRLVNDVLSLSKLESGMDTLDASYFNITSLLRSLIERYSALRAVEGYTLEFIYDGEYTVYGDELKLTQVFYNLINNAIAYTGESHHVTVKQSAVPHGGKLYVRFDVIDDGDGISEENLPYIWDRYYKENRTHKRAEVGTGLGLSIVKRVIELHGGNYGVESRVGEGSDFRIELPTASDAPSAESVGEDM